MRFYGEKCVRHEGWDWSDGIWRRSREMTALRLLSVIDLWWIYLASALFKHELVLRWSLPDDDLHDDISLPDDHVTYEMLRGVLTRTIYPPCILCVLAAFPPSHIPSHPISAYPMTSRNPSFWQHTWGSTHGVYPAWVCACICAQMNSCINKCAWAVRNVSFCICVRTETGPSRCQ